MIINIRGTSGSGKSTLVRRAMDQFHLRVPYKIPNRRQPIGYVLSNHVEGDRPSLAVIGHYETPCGGCDTIQKMDDIYRLVRESHAAGHNVLYEGLLISADVNRALAVHEEGLPLCVIALTQVSLTECLEGVNKRRRARMGDKFTPVAEKNTTSKHRGTILSANRLEAAGVEVHRVGRDAAWEILQDKLDLS